MSGGPSDVGPRHPASAGTWSATGSSSRSTPSATSRISAAPVNDFVIEAIRNTVSASGGVASSVVTPPDSTGPSVRTTPQLTAGAC